jgi:Pathogenicity locus
VREDRAMTESDLQTIPNVGPAVARKLARLDIARVADLRGRDGEELFDRLCAIDARRHDPCLLDTFVAAVDYANGAPPRPWWEYSRERKARAHG